jgi:enamine deaminase RidA (YjgF/YER057c/UK114 family)
MQRECAVERRDIDPFGGWDRYASVPAIEIVNPSRMLICSGMCAPNENGRSVLPASDVRGQIAAALDKVQVLLRASDYTLADAVRMNIYTLDVQAVMDNYDIIVHRLTDVGAKIAGTMVGVTRLGLPDLMIEIEVTAFK